eukprot:14138163-Alexandrium_andersonii.AAC.1
MELHALQIIRRQLASHVLLAAKRTSVSETSMASVGLSGGRVVGALDEQPPVMPLFTMQRASQFWLLLCMGSGQSGES